MTNRSFDEESTRDDEERARKSAENTVRGKTKKGVNDNSYLRKSTIRIVSFLAVGAFLVLLSLSDSWFGEQARDNFAHLAILVFVAAIVHLVDFYILHNAMLKDLKESLSKRLDEFKPEIRKQTSKALQDIQPLVERASEIGLIAIYRNRDEAKTYIDEAVHRAGRKINICAVGLSEKVEQKEYFRVATDKINLEDNFDVRFLFLDPLSSTATFRGLLEEDSSRTEIVVTGNPTKAATLESYCDQRVYTDAERTIRTLKNFKSLITDSNKVRFYRHAPAGFLAICDQDCFYQPYTFGGRPQNHSGDFCIGDLMPVFHYRQKLNVKSPYQVLKDHFNKLWFTSDTDFYHMQNRMSHADIAIERILESRRTWLSRAWKELYEADITQRDNIRRPCKAQQTPQISVEWKGSSDDKRHKIQGSVVNYSAKTIALNLAGHLSPEELPSESAEVNLSIKGKENKFPEFFTALRNGNLYSKDGLKTPLQVVRIHTEFQTDHDMRPDSDSDDHCVMVLGAVSESRESTA